VASILVVDDNPAFSGAIERSLTRKGCRVTTAADGDEGLRAVHQQSFDVVITHLDAPQHGCVWLWENAVQVRPELRGRFLMVTSEPLPRAAPASFILESEHVLVRPSHADALWHRVPEVLQRGGVTVKPPSGGDQISRSAGDR